jgi:hypothetical protein
MEYGSVYRIVRCTHCAQDIHNLCAMCINVECYNKLIFEPMEKVDRKSLTAFLYLLLW